MEEKSGKMGEEREKEKESGVIASKIRKKKKKRSYLIYYYSLQKPYELVGAVGRAVVRWFRFRSDKDNKSTPDESQRSVGGLPTSTPPPSSLAVTTTMAARSYNKTVIKSRAPPIPSVSSGRPPQHH